VTLKEFRWPTALAERHYKTLAEISILFARRIGHMTDGLLEPFSNRLASMAKSGMIGAMEPPVSQPPELESISVFFPCYNEEGNLRRVYESASEMLKRMQMDYEIILVNDGSTDGTASIANAIAADDPRVRAIHHPANLGYGSALQSGFRAATKALVFYTDGDGQFSLDELPPLIPLMKQYDIVSCFRLNRQDGLIRRLNAWCWTTLVGLVFRLKIKDINCAFKLYKRRVFAGMDLQSTGALINAEILARASRRGFTVTQVGVHHFPRTQGRQTGSNFTVIFRALGELAKLSKHIKNNNARPGVGD
jgi:glycosyltransferase involved in cell wall biosynthesis